MSRRPSVVVLAMFAVLALAGTPAHRVQAQAALDSGALARLPVGATLRVRTAEPGFTLHVGQLVAARHDGLRLRVRNDLVDLPAQDIREIGVSAGRRPPGEAFARGAGWGLLTGVAVTVAATGVGAYSDRQCSDYCFGTIAGVVLGAGFTVVSTVVGGFAGLAHRERWQREWPPR